MDSDQTAPWEQFDQCSCCCFHENALEMQQTPSLMQGEGGGGIEIMHTACLRLKMGPDDILCFIFCYLSKQGRHS